MLEGLSNFTLVGLALGTFSLVGILWLAKHFLGGKAVGNRCFALKTAAPAFAVAVE